MKSEEFWLLALLSAACVEPDSGAGFNAGDRPPLRIAEQVIDARSAVELEPGAGVGVATAYLGEGRWELMAACDTAATGSVCRFDIVLSSDPDDGELSDSEALELESDDDVRFLDPFALQLLLVTATDLDGVAVSAPPGATLRVSALFYDPVDGSRFDWTDDPRLLSWVGHGAVNWGAPTNPVDLTPDQP